MNIIALLQGFGLGTGLIIAIGAQNAFVLRQGLKRQRLFVTASLCTCCDIILICFGVGGLGTIITTIPLLTIVATWGGVLFLLYYGWHSFRSMATSGSMNIEIEKNHRNPSLSETIVTILAFSLLNPHAFLDTVVLIGSIGSHYVTIGNRWSFALGAMGASLTWFFSLAYGAAWLAPYFRHTLTWTLLDGFIGCVMWIIAGSLIWSILFH